jgi:hypothetical protein
MVFENESKIRIFSDRPSYIQRKIGKENKLQELIRPKMENEFFWKKNECLEQTVQYAERNTRRNELISGALWPNLPKDIVKESTVANSPKIIGESQLVKYNSFKSWLVQYTERNIEKKKLPNMPNLSNETHLPQDYLCYSMPLVNMDCILQYTCQ